jgi:hypothetical protein
MSFICCTDCCVCTQHTHSDFTSLDIRSIRCARLYHTFHRPSTYGNMCTCRKFLPPGEQRRHKLYGIHTIVYTARTARPRIHPVVTRQDKKPSSHPFMLAPQLTATLGPSCDPPVHGRPHHPTVPRPRAAIPELAHCRMSPTISD